jgi:glutathione S-transferase
MSMTTDTSSSTQQVLYDVPVSNNGARCRIVLYKKGISDNEIKIVSPAEVGGLKSNDYLSINPQGKMPAYTCSETGTNLAESDTIVRYLLSKYSTIGPSFQPELPLSNYICRIHDLYLGPIQSCMYKMPPFSQFGTRSDALAEFVKQMNVIENLLPGNTQYLCNDELSHADAALFPTMIFANHMLPKYDITPPLPPKIQKWFDSLLANDAVFQKVYTEVMESLKQWDERGRFDPLLGAGWRDTEPRTLFGTSYKVKKK